MNFIAVGAVAAASPSAFDQPGTLGFLVVFGMAVVLYFLFRSMVRHLRKVNSAAASEHEQQEASTAASSTAASSTGAAASSRGDGPGAG